MAFTNDLQYLMCTQRQPAFKMKLRQVPQMPSGDRNLCSQLFQHTSLTTLQHNKNTHISLFQPLGYYIINVIIYNLSDMRPLDKSTVLAKKQQSCHLPGCCPIQQVASRLAAHPRDPAPLQHPGFGFTTFTMPYPRLASRDPLQFSSSNEISRTCQGAAFSSVYRLCCCGDSQASLQAIASDMKTSVPVWERPPAMLRSQLHLRLTTSKHTDAQDPKRFHTKRPKKRAVAYKESFCSHWSNTCHVIHSISKYHQVCPCSQELYDITEDKIEAHKSQKVSFELIEFAWK